MTRVTNLDWVWVGLMNTGREDFPKPHYEIVIQFKEGGITGSFRPNAHVNEVIDELKQMIAMLERRV